MLRRLRRASHFAAGRKADDRNWPAAEPADWATAARGSAVRLTLEIGVVLAIEQVQKTQEPDRETDSVDSMAQAIGLVVRETLEVAEKPARFRDLAKAEMFGALARAGQRVAPVAADFGAAVARGGAGGRGGGGGRRR